MWCCSITTVLYLGFYFIWRRLQTVELVHGKMTSRDGTDVFILNVLCLHLHWYKQGVFHILTKVQSFFFFFLFLFRPYTFFESAHTHWPLVVLFKLHIMFGELTLHISMCNALTQRYKLSNKQQVTSLGATLSGSRNTFSIRLLRPGGRRNSRTWARFGRGMKKSQIFSRIPKADRWLTFTNTWVWVTLSGSKRSSPSSVMWARHRSPVERFETLNYD